MEEIKENSNCITKAFESHPIFIFKEEKENKKHYYFKASDVGKALDIVNIRTSIQNFDEDEMVVRETYTLGGNQNTLFLTSNGVYRLLYNSKKPLAKQFRRWAGEILDDIIFNDSKELQKKLKEKEQEMTLKNEEIKKKEQEIEEKNEQLKIAESKTLKLTNRITDNEVFTKTGYIYFATSKIYCKENQYRFGRTIDLKDRQSGYQIGRATTDNLYYIFVYSCEEPELLEYYIRRLLKSFRDNSRKDFYVLPWQLLKKYVIEICENYDKSIITTNKLIVSNLNFNEDEEIPEEFDINIFYNKTEEKQEEQEVTRKIEELKKCNLCEKKLPLSNFTIVREGDDLLRTECRACRTKDSAERLKKIKENPMIGKKKCSNCEIILDHCMFFKDADILDGFMNHCRECYIKINLDINIKQCNKCFEIKNHVHFNSDAKKSDKLATICKQCKSTADLIICNKCDAVVNKTKLPKHQATKTCILAYENKLIYLQKKEKEENERKAKQTKEEREKEEQEIKKIQELKEIEENKRKENQTNEEKILENVIVLEKKEVINQVTCDRCDKKVAKKSLSRHYKSISCQEIYKQRLLVVIK